MCVANLNVSLRPCSHRWYTLARPCHPGTNLSNCPQKLKLEGWETRNQSCPWCDAAASPVDDSTHRLFGASSGGSISSVSSGSRSRSNSLGGAVPVLSQPAAASVASQRRRLSIATNSSTSRSRSRSTSPITSAIVEGEGTATPPSDDTDDERVLSRGDRARLQNYRMNLYLFRDPASELRQKAFDDETAAGAGAGAASPVVQSDTESGAAGARRGSLRGMKWKKKSMKLGMSMFK